MAKKYVVKEGDNLAELSRKLGVPIDEIQSYNGIRNLTPGQTIRVPVQREKKQAGYYQTGEGEQLTFSQGGTTIRLGENSSISPKGPTNKFQQFMKIMSGQAGNDASQYQMAVSGDQLSDVQRNAMIQSGQIANPNTITTGEGEYQTVTGPNGEQIRIGPNSTYTPTSTQPKTLGVLDSALEFFRNLSGNWGNPSSQPASIRGSNNKGINGLASPVQGPGGQGPQPGGILGTQSWQGRPNQAAPWVFGAASYAPQGWYSYADPTANMSTPTQRPIGSEYPNPINPFPSSTNRILQQGMYPIGSEYPNPVQPKAAPFLTSTMLANPTYGNPLPTPTSNYGNYAAGNKLYSGQAKTAQESYQQTGNLSGGSRWWIKKGQGNDAAARARANALANARVMSQGKNVMQASWRV